MRPEVEAIVTLRKEQAAARRERFIRRALAKERKRYPRREAARHKEQIKAWREAHPDYDKARYWADHEWFREARRQRYHKYYASWKAWNQQHGYGTCSSCGLDDFASLHWHHVRPETKSFELSRLHARKPTPSVIRLYQEEATKCIVLCSYCHADAHRKEAA
jgi:hypothetical protein